MAYVNIADLPCPHDPEKRTYREINAEKTHTIPIGALVEILRWNDHPYKNGCRLFVVNHARDCDMTPLYYLSANHEDTKQRIPGLMNPGWTGGFSDRSLMVVELPPATRPPEQE